MSAPSSNAERRYDGAEVHRLCAAVTAAGGLFPFRADGQSMAPALPDGALVVLGATPAAPPLGAIVLALRGDKAFLHRVLLRWRGRVWLAGDANAHADGWIPSAAIAGMVVRWQVAAAAPSSAVVFDARRRWGGWGVAVLRRIARRRAPGWLPKARTR